MKRKGGIVKSLEREKKEIRLGQKRVSRKKVGIMDLKIEKPPGE